MTDVSIDPRQPNVISSDDAAFFSDNVRFLVLRRDGYFKHADFRKYADNFLKRVTCSTTRDGDPEQPITFRDTERTLVSMDADNVTSNIGDLPADVVTFLRTYYWLIRGVRLGLQSSTA